MSGSKLVAGSSSIITLFAVFFLAFQPSVVHAAKTAQFANINYDVVYVRCPRGKEPVSKNGTWDLLNWNGVNDIWVSAANNVYQEPGCDLVLHHSDQPPGDPAAEEVLVNCNEDDTTQPVCSVLDPNVSFDGRYVVYSKFTDTRTFVTSFGTRGIDHIGSQNFMQLFPAGDAPDGGYAKSLFGGLMPYASPALVYIYDLKTGTNTQVSPDSKFFAGRAFPGKDPEWTSNIPVMDTGPFFTPDGRIGFTSNRDNGFGMFQLFVMDRDGKNMTLIGHRAMNDQLHPFVLTDGRIVYTSFDAGFLQRPANNDFSLFTINPDGSDPFIFAGKSDPTEWVYHFGTQLSDGDVVVTLYYDEAQQGLGTLERIPVDPPGPDFVHRANIGGAVADPFTQLTKWTNGISYTPFARVDEFRLTPQAGPDDVPTGPYTSSADYWVDPVDGRTVTMNGRFTHPAAAPDNNLLVTYAIGGDSTSPSDIYKQSLATTMQVIGKDAGIWLVPLEAHSTRQVGHIADDARIVVDFPQYHEIMPRAVVPYQSIYGIPRPDPNNLRGPTTDDGTKDPRLPAGVPYGLTGAATLYDRETRALNGTPWNVKDGGGTMSGRTYNNLGTSGAELAIFNNSEIYGIRVLMPIPNIVENKSIGTDKFAGVQTHQVRILGEFPVRKPDANGVEPTDGQGNPDTSFVVRIPADTPFMFQTIDKRGMALDIETAPRDVARGEQQYCGGCHVHTRTSLDPFSSIAVNDTAVFGDMTGHSAMLFSGLDSKGYPVVQKASDIYSYDPGVNMQRSFTVDWDNDIKNVIQNRCASCHGEGQSAQVSTGLLLDNTDRTYDLLTTNHYTGSNGPVDANTKPGDGLTGLDNPANDRITPRYDCCTPSRWLSVNSARSSMLVWALYGERLDGRDPTTGLPPANSGVLVDPDGLEHPEIWPKVADHAAYVSSMPESEKRLIARWIDLGAAKSNSHNDLIRPVLTVTPVDGGGGTVSSIKVGLWDDSPLDYSRFTITANGTNITPTISGTPDVVDVTLPTTITSTNADSWQFVFEIWDKPDRSMSNVQPGVPAANRTRRVITGSKLLAMLGNDPPNSKPTATSATITAYLNAASAGVIPSVTDPDIEDSHLYSIVSQPAHGSATVVNNRLVYTPSTGYTGTDSFTFRATDLGGLSVDGTASVTVLDAPPPTPLPVITSQPSSISVATDQPVKFTVVAAGGGTLNYQWRRNGNDISGATSNSYQFTSSSSDNGAVFSCVVSNTSGSVTSSSATLTVTSTTTTENFNFDNLATSGWTPLTPSRWDVVTDGGGYVYHLNTTNYDGTSGDGLGEYSLLDGKYGDFNLTMQAKLGDDVTVNAQADYAIVFGYQDADNYYYMMFNNDPAYTQLYKVVNGQRQSVAAASSDVVNDNAYHSVGVSRSGSNITVSFDGATVLTATDSTFGVGQVGVGSLNDSAYFDNIALTTSISASATSGGTNDSSSAGATGPLLSFALLAMLYARRRRRLS